MCSLNQNLNICKIINFRPAIFDIIRKLLYISFFVMLYVFFLISFLFDCFVIAGIEVEVKVGVSSSIKTAFTGKNTAVIAGVPI